MKSRINKMNIRQTAESARCLDLMVFELIFFKFNAPF